MFFSKLHLFKRLWPRALAVFRFALKRPYPLVLKIRIYAADSFPIFLVRRRARSQTTRPRPFLPREALNTAKSFPELMASSATCSPCFRCPLRKSARSRASCAYPFFSTLTSDTIQRTFRKIEAGSSCFARLVVFKSPFVFKAFTFIWFVQIRKGQLFNLSPAIPQR
jgi:hypothetical protein